MKTGDILELKATSMAHGGEAIAHAADGRVVFVLGAVPGDTVLAAVTKTKKRWARAETVEVLTPSEHRIAPTCEAAAHGAGCCDYAVIAPEAQLGFKQEVLVGQLNSLAQRSGVLERFDLAEIEPVQLNPTLGWRTRVRLGVDEQGRAGMRKRKSTEVVTETCSQVVPGLIHDLSQFEFTPGAEVVAVMDSNGHRHIVESSKVPRGRRVEKITQVIEGTGEVIERADGHQFTFPATAFWQAHTNAPDAYTQLIRLWTKDSYESKVGWDLYGGVGVFVPAIADALGSDGKVISVDYSSSVDTMQPELDGYNLELVNGRVEAVVDKLERPGLVVLDPPRAGAGKEVIEATAAKAPEQIIHVGCDPSTFARDLADWGAAGYRVNRMALIDAFPNTHHFEVMAELSR
ncbi:class I SAM-dependent RNA methyltransferase [Corynebacterium sp. S7]